MLLSVLSEGKEVIVSSIEQSEKKEIITVNLLIKDNNENKVNITPLPYGVSLKGNGYSSTISIIFGDYLDIAYNYKDAEPEILYDVLTPKDVVIYILLRKTDKIISTPNKYLIDNSITNPGNKALNYNKKYRIFFIPKEEPVGP